MHLIHAIFEPHVGTVRIQLSWHSTVGGANALDLLGLAPYLCGGRCLVLCPQALCRYLWDRRAP